MRGLDRWKEQVEDAHSFAKGCWPCVVCILCVACGQCECPREDEGDDDGE